MRVETAIFASVRGRLPAMPSVSPTVQATLWNPERNGNERFDGLP